MEIQDQMAAPAGPIVLMKERIILAQFQGGRKSVIGPLEVIINIIREL
jgi:hypothetical protein